MIVCEQALPKIYAELLERRRVSVVAAAICLHQAQNWLQNICQHNNLELDKLSPRNTTFSSEKLNSPHECVKHHLVNLMALSDALEKFERRLKAFNVFAPGNQIQAMHSDLQELENTLKIASCSITLQAANLALNHEFQSTRQRFESHIYWLNFTLLGLTITSYVVGLLINPWFFVCIASACLAKVAASYLLTDTFDYIANQQVAVVPEELDNIILSGKSSLMPAPEELKKKPSFFRSWSSLLNATDDGRPRSTPRIRLDSL